MDGVQQFEDEQSVFGYANRKVVLRVLSTPGFMSAFEHSCWWEPECFGAKETRHQEILRTTDHWPVQVAQS